MQTALTPTQMEAAERHRAFHRRIAARAACVAATPVPRQQIMQDKVRAVTQIEISEHVEADTDIEVTASNGQVVFVTLKAVAEATESFNRALSGRLTIDRIQHVVAQHYGVSRMDLLSARRTADVVRPRQLAMYLAKAMTPRSLPEIGRRFGNRDHTTVLHAVRKMTALRETDTAVAADIDALTATLEMRTN